MSTSTTTLEELRQEYESKATSAKKYATANFIFGLDDADTTYLQLLIERDTAYFNYKKLEVGEPTFSRLHAPVINHRLGRYQDLLKSIKGMIV